MAQINRYTKAIDNALEQYVPLPFDTMFKAGQATQQRYDQSVVDDTATQTGLASIEARSPAYKQYVDKAISSYRDASSNLIKQFNGRLDDPEFKRQQKQLINQYANDPAFQTIKLGNEGIKRSQDIEAQMRAQGKLYISDLPNFKGTDANGRLAVYNGAPQAVNTLDDWTKAGQIAHQSTEDIGNITTNKRNLDRWKQSITGDVAGQTRLLQAYQQQGMSPQQAAQAVKSSIQGLVNQYGVETKTNTRLLNLGLQREEFAYRKQRDAAEDQLKRDLAAAKNAGKSPIDPSLPSVRQNDLGFTTQGSNSKGGVAGTSQFVPTLGSSSINVTQKIGGGLKNFQGGFYRQTASTDNKSYNGTLARQSGAAKITDGEDTGLHNVAVNSKGDVITSKEKGEFTNRNGKTYYKYKDGSKTIEVPAEPRTMRVINDKATGSIYYAPVNEQEAMRYMGATGAYWEGRKTIAEQFNYKGNSPTPEGLRQTAASFNFNDPNTIATLQSIGGARGYGVDLISNVFNKAASNQKLNTSEASVLDNILTDITNQARYNQFNKAEFDNQGKRSNINNGLFKTPYGNPLNSKGVSDTYTNFQQEEE